MNIGLTMRTIIRWEQLRGKSFAKMDYKCEEDIIVLLYCSALSCNPEKIFTLKEFRNTTSNEKLMRGMSQKISLKSLVMAQFRTTEDIDASIRNTEGSSGRIGDIVSTLIMGGMDARYVMDELELCDLPMFIRAYENRRKEQMESDRLWTYLTILPHVDGKKIPSARELYPFPWEQKEIEEAAAKSIQEDTDKLEAFFEHGKNLIKQNYGG